MHRGFFDKRRRFLNFRTPQVDNVLPEHFIEYYPKFIDLLKTYYDWQGEYPSTELIAHQRHNHAKQEASQQSTGAHPPDVRSQFIARTKMLHKFPEATGQSQYSNRYGKQKEAVRERPISELFIG